MRKQTVTLIIVVVIMAAMGFPLLAQEPNPTCHRCQATYIPKSELDAYTQRAIKNRIVDQQVRSVDAGKLQIGIGMVTRGKLVPGSGGEDAVAEHEQIGEVYYVIDGSATLLTGPDLVNPKKGRYSGNCPRTEWSRFQLRLNQEPPNPRTEARRHDHHSRRDRALVHEDRRPHNICNGAARPRQGRSSQE